MKQSANWFSWVVHFIVGFMAGPIVLFAGSLSNLRLRTNIGTTVFPSGYWFLGAALLCAGLASWHGHRFWSGGSPTMIPPDAMQHSNTSQILSALTTLAGCVLLCMAFFA